ncbi:MAG: hypothetical protein WBG46_12230 [Nonlabens sp.]
MKNINLIYVIAFVVGCFLATAYYFRGQQVITFYGFAQNEETNLNRRYSLEVAKIHVQTGQSVQKGDILMDVKTLELPMQMDRAELSIDELRVKYEQNRNRLNREIANLTSKYLEDSNQLKSQIGLKQSELENNLKLYNSLESVQGNNEEDLRINSPLAKEITSLENELSIIDSNYKTQLKGMESERDAPENPTLSRIKILESENKYYDLEAGKQKITAPTDGLIGNIPCKEGEIISPYETLISFYERRPSQVVGYIHEELLLRVNINDTITVSSASRPDVTNTGVIRNLGSRIVQIPTRITKVKDYETYGREVLIEIPRDNPFLQKEKVTLTLME